jgi:hypothetical protein
VARDSRESIILDCFILLAASGSALELKVNKKATSNSAAEENGSVVAG